MITAAAAALLLLPTPASADDAGVLSAYNGRQPELQQGIDAYVSASRAARRAGRRVTDDQLRAIISGDQQINAVLVQLAGDVKAQQASSATGRKARTYALREIVLWRRANELEIAGLEYEIARRPRQAEAAYTRGLRTYRRSQRYGRLTQRTFRKIGLKTPGNDIGD
jgi:hypothetical protein